MSKKIIGLLFIIIVIAFFLNYKSLLKVFYPRQFEEFVKEYSTEYKLDENLVYSLIKIESKFDSYARSKKEAAGLMQITPQTAAYIARLIDVKSFEKEDLFDPKTNIRFGCFYFSKLLHDFNGDMVCALAAYNGGEGNVRKWIASEESGKLHVENIPYNETRKYVKLVKKNYRVYEELYSNNDSDILTSMIRIFKKVLED